MIALLLLGFALGSPPQWPQVAVVERHYVFKEAEDPKVDLQILDLQEVPVYRLECHDGSFQDPGFTYSGLFQCRLTQIGQSYDSRSRRDLLSDYSHPTRDWLSRARFLLEQFEPYCADIPDYGRMRTFRLRGMMLILEANKVESPESRPLMQLKVQVRQDLTADGWYSDLPEKTNPVFSALELRRKLARECSFFYPGRERETMEGDLVPEVSRCPNCDELLDRARKQGSVLVFAEVKIPKFPAPWELPIKDRGQVEQERKEAVAKAQEKVLKRMEKYTIKDYSKFEHPPFLRMTVDVTALEDLISNPDIISSTSPIENKISRANLPQAETNSKCRCNELLNKARKYGYVDIIVGLVIPDLPDDTRAPHASKEEKIRIMQARKEAISNAQDRLLKRMEKHKLQMRGKFYLTPGMSMRVDAAALEALIADPEVSQAHS